MGFIHHATDAAGATGLMDGTGHPQGSVMFEHAGPLANTLPCLTIIPAYYFADRAPATAAPQSGHEAADPIPPTRFHVVIGQEH
jgi:hypothetical protein